MRGLVLLAWSMVAFTGAATAVFGFMFYEAYWRWRGCFNSEGNCFDGVVNHRTESMAWIFPALPSGALCLVFLWFALRPPRA